MSDSSSAMALQCNEAQLAETTEAVISSEIAISVRNLGKSYRLWNTPQDRLKQPLRSMFSRWLPPISHKQYFNEFWALRDINFDVKKGETLGIIGRNGSGKSTLLQILCGTLAPTCGKYETRGRISALLELGSGFNPEFSGRDNVYMNASILGLTKDEIDERYGSIVEFADIGQFIDQPVKTYSSGMYVRLAFAVAISVDPDVLVVDEALAVGDEMFQRKCYSRLRLLQENGATILFVSHATGTVVELCSVAILVETGTVLLEGNPKFVVSQYHKLTHAPRDRWDELKTNMIADACRNGIEISPSLRVLDPGDKKESEQSKPFYDSSLATPKTIMYCNLGANIGDPCIETVDGQKVNNLVRGESYLYRYTVEFLRSASSIRFGMMIKTMTGLELGGAVSSPVSDAIPFVNSRERIVVKWMFKCSLTPGLYFLNGGVLGFIDDEEVYLDRKLDLLVFRIIPERNSIVTGLIDFEITCNCYNFKNMPYPGFGI